MTACCDNSSTEVSTDLSNKSDDRSEGTRRRAFAMHRDLEGSDQHQGRS